MKLAIEINEYEVFKRIPHRRLIEWMEDDDSISSFMAMALKRDLATVANGDKELKMAIKRVLRFVS